MIWADSNIIGVGGAEEKILHKSVFTDEISLLFCDHFKSFLPGYKINWGKSEAKPISKTCYAHV